MSVTRRVASFCLSLLVLSIGAVSQVHADDAAAAARAYSQGQAAEVAGQPGQSAELYETAYRFAPHPVSLRAAIRTHLTAGHKAASATLCERLLTRHSDDLKSVEYARQVLDQVRPEVARLAVKCEVDCVVLVDNQAATLDSGTEHAVYVLPGTRNLSVRFVQAGVESEAQPVEAVAGGDASAEFAAPILPPEPEPTSPTAPAPMAAPEPKFAGIAPIYTIAVAGAALVVGGVATWSALDVVKAHDSYDRKDRDAPAQYDEGKKLEKRTNALIGVAAGVAVAAGVMAIFTRWHPEEDEEDDKEPPATALGAGPGLVGLSLTNRF